MELINKTLSGFQTRDIKVVQFGEGNFLRGFADYMIDIANKKNLFNGNIVLIKPVAYGDVERFNKQECQYTVLLRGIIEGKDYVEKNIVSSCADIVSPFIDYKKYLDVAKIDTLRFVVSNTTEAGIVFDETDLFEEKYKVTFPAKLTQFLKARFDHFNGDMHKGLIMLPVELIDDNGIVLKEYVLKYIDLWKLPGEFKDWVNNACIFTNTLVDRIVPGYPFDEAHQIWEELGYKDELIVTAEPFALWVIEAEKNIQELLPLDKALEDKSAMKVIFTDNQKPYKQRKVRILNGAHTSFALAGYLAGYDYVKEALDDKLIKKFVIDTVYQEIIPTLDLPKDELMGFAASIIDRFNNPYIKHSLLAISLNSVSKFKARCLPSLLKYYEITGKIPEHLAFAIASLLAFYTGNEIENETLKGNRYNQDYLIKDDLDVLLFFKENSVLSLKEYAENYLGNLKFNGINLNEITGLSELVIEYLGSIRNIGMKKTMEKYFGEL